MSTDISTVDNETALAPFRAGNFKLGELIMVKIPPQGLTTWTWSTVLGEFSAKEITGTIIALSNPQQDVWPHSGKAEPNTTPYLRSIDGVRAYVVGNDAGDLDLKHIEEASNGDGSYDCSKITYFQWQKDGTRNIPPRANATSVIGILREGTAAPLFIRLSKTSNPVVQKFAQRLRAEGVLPWQSVVTLGLETAKGSYATYSRATIRYVKPSDAEYAERYKACFEIVSPLLQGPINKKQAVAEDLVPF